MPHLRGLHPPPRSNADKTIARTESSARGRTGAIPARCAATHRQGACVCDLYSLSAMKAIVLGIHTAFRISRHATSPLQPECNNALTIFRNNFIISPLSFIMQIHSLRLGWMETPERSVIMRGTCCNNAGKLRCYQRIKPVWLFDSAPEKIRQKGCRSMFTGFRCPKIMAAVAKPEPATRSQFPLALRRR